MAAATPPIPHQSPSRAVVPWATMKRACRSAYPAPVGWRSSRSWRPTRTTSQRPFDDSHTIQNNLFIGDLETSPRSPDCRGRSARNR
jgi:hypothetical protein